MVKLRPFGERIVVKLVDEEPEGKIAFPERVNSSFCIGKIVAVPEKSPKPIFVEVGNIVMFQIDASQQRNCSYVIDDHQVVFFLHQRDFICRLKTNVINLDNVEMLGEWLLVRPYIPQQGTIVVPESAVAKTPDMWHFDLVKLGSGVTLDIAPGSELAVAKSRVTPMMIGSDRFGFISQEFIYGAM